MKKNVIYCLILCLIVACTNTQNNEQTQTNADTIKSIQPDEKCEMIDIIIDTDANNEVDDQHALAYTFFNGDVFHVVGVTVNNTRNGAGIENHYIEARRIIKLCDVEGTVPLYKGADGIYADIKDKINETEFDGHEAVDFIIEQAKAMPDDDTLVLAPIGKLTNIALALLKAPEIIPKVKVVWLGANYPKPGEYNLDNDTTAVNPVIESGVAFELVTVRYDDTTGTTAVTITPDEINKTMPGLGPRIAEPVTGRHGGEFNNFGDYSVNLFSHIELHGDPPARSLFDLAAIAIIKNPDWAECRMIPAPRLVGKEWVDRPNYKKTIKLWENFDRDQIVNDFIATMKNYEKVE